MPVDREDQGTNFQLSVPVLLCTLGARLQVPVEATLSHASFCVHEREWRLLNELGSGHTAQYCLTKQKKMLLFFPSVRKNAFFTRCRVYLWAVRHLKKTMAETRRTEAWLKIAVTGPTGGGKTSLISRIVDDVFNVAHNETVGVDRITWTHGADTECVHTTTVFLDCPGALRFKNIRRMQYQFVEVVIVVFNISSTMTVDVEEWIAEVRQTMEPTAPLILACTHGEKMPPEVDGRDQEITRMKRMNLLSEASEALAYMGKTFVISCKNGDGIDELRDELARIRHTRHTYNEAVSESERTSAERECPFGEARAPSRDRHLLRMVAVPGLDTPLPVAQGLLASAHAASVADRAKKV